MNDFNQLGLYASGLVRYLVGSPEDTCSSFRQALQCRRVQLQHGPLLCLWTCVLEKCTWCHNFSSGLHRKYCTEIVNLLYSEGYTGPPSASCSFLFSSCSLSPAAPSDFSLAARSSALAVLAPYLHANEMFNYYVIKIGSCKYTWYKQHH